jgi:hypothetical protein
MLTQFVAPALYLALRFAPGSCRIRILRRTGHGTWADPANVLRNALCWILGVYPAKHLYESCDGLLAITRIGNPCTTGTRGRTDRRLLRCTGQGTWADPANVLRNALCWILGVYPARHLSTAFSRSTRIENPCTTGTRGRTDRRPRPPTLSGWGVQSGAGSQGHGATPSQGHGARRAERTTEA